MKYRLFVVFVVRGGTDGATRVEMDRRFSPHERDGRLAATDPFTMGSEKRKATACQTNDSAVGFEGLKYESRHDTLQCAADTPIYLVRSSGRH